MFDTSMPRRRRRGGLVIAIVAVAVVVALVVTYFVTKQPVTGGTGAAPVGNTVSSTASGPPTSPPIPHVKLPDEGAVFNKTSLANLAVSLDGAAAQGATLTLDGVAVQPTTSGATLTWKPATLADGPHALVITGAGLPGGKVERKFSVDTTAPKLSVTAPKPLAGNEKSLALTGTTDPGQVVTGGGQTATAAADGTFTLTFASAPSAVTVEATDAAGNTAKTDVTVVSVVPTTRAVHLTALAWAYDPLRKPVLEMLKNKQLTAIELDIKDEEGIVGYNSQVPLVKQAKANGRIYDARKTIDEIHKLGGRVIGRLVCFRDPAFAKWAWLNGHRDAVIQTPDGTPYTGPYGSGGYAFTNFANKLVRDYNNDIAVEAAKLGFDDILFDYVRRPDGKLSTMKIPGMSKNPSADVAEFVHQTRVAISAAGTKTFLGASVFGIAATRPVEIAQNIPMLGKYLDYVAPMVYPSHWGPGEYNLSNPNDKPYEIVQRSLKDFQKDLKGTHAVVVPWLQDFYRYTPAQVMAQIKGAHDDGIDSYLLWNAGATYTSSAIRP